MKLSENGIKLSVTPLSARLTGPPLIMPNLIKELRWMDGRPACVCVGVCMRVCEGGLMSGHMHVSVLTCMFVFLSEFLPYVRAG